MKLLTMVALLAPFSVTAMMHRVALISLRKKQEVRAVRHPHVQRSLSFGGNIIWHQLGRDEGFATGYHQAHNEAAVERDQQIYHLYKELIQQHAEKSSTGFEQILKHKARMSALSVKRELTKDLLLAQEASHSWFSNSTYWNQEITRLEQEIARIDAFINSRCASKSQISNNEQ